MKTVKILILNKTLVIISQSLFAHNEVVISFNFVLRITKFHSK